MVLDVERACRGAVRPGREASRRGLRSIVGSGRSRGPIPASAWSRFSIGVIRSFRAAAALIGYRRDEVIGENVKILTPEPYRSEHDGYVDNDLRTGEKRIIGYSRLVKAVTKDGAVFPIARSVGEARSKNRRMFTGFVRDLTSRQKMEDELPQCRKWRRWANSPAASRATSTIS